MVDQLAKEQAKAWTGDVKEVTTRLYQDKQAQLDKTMAIQEKHKDSECTFQPAISYNSERKAQKATKGRTF